MNKLRMMSKPGMTNKLRMTGEVPFVRNGQSRAVHAALSTSFESDADEGGYGQRAR